MERPKLLLADDSLTVQRVVNLTFSEEGFDVVAVGDGDAAVREIASARPDIVLADVHMPGPSGYEICSLLRGIEETAATPVILLVGSFEQFDPEEAERAGADAFVTKPFQSIRQLVDQVRELLAKRESSSVVSDAVVEAAQQPVPPEKDTRDIDSLYEQSFAEPSGTNGEVVDPASFPMVNMDDEIIETVYGSEISAGSNSGDGYHADNYGQINGSTSEAVLEPDLDDGSSVSFEETLQMEVPTQYARGENTAPSLQTAPTEELRRDPFATTTDAFDLDDLNLLDLSASQVEEQFSFGTATQSVEAGSSKQVVSISPELMDIIVRKVVEKLSEKY